ncbi:hypothetical protein D3C81_1942550 [compost metagenome]
MTAIRIPINSGASGPRGMPLPSSVSARIRHIRMAVITVSTRKAWPTEICALGYVEKMPANSRLSLLPRTIWWAASKSKNRL